MAAALPYEGSVADEMLGAKPTPSRALDLPALPYARSVADEMLGTAEVRSMPTGTPMPQGQATVVDSPQGGAPPIVSAGAGMLPDTGDQIRYYASRRFPHLPVEESAKRYGVIDGNIVYSGDDGRTYREVPSVAGGSIKEPVDMFQRFAAWLASQAGPAIPSVAGGAAGVMLGPTGGSILKSGGAAAATDLARQFVGGKIAGTDIAGQPVATAGVDYVNAAGHGLENAAGQALGVGFSKLLNRNPLEVQRIDRASALDPQRQQAAISARDQARAQGIGMTPGQATALPSLLSGERQVARDVAGMDTMGEFYKTQRGQIASAVDRALGRVSPVQTVDEGITAARTGSAETIAAATAERQRIAGPYYERAFTNPDGLPATVKAEDVSGKAIDYINQLLDKAPESAGLRSARGLFFAKDAAGDTLMRAGQPVLKTRVDQLHEVKMTIDGMLERQGENAISRSERRNLMQLQDNLVNNWLAKASDAYDTARTVFKNNSPPVNELTEGTVGLVAGREGEVAKRTELGDLFDFRKTTPDQVLIARNAFEKAGTLDKWNAALATHIREQFSAAGGSPQKFLNSVWGNEANQRERDVLRMAMDGQAFAGFQRLMQTLERVAKTLPEGSPTATDLPGGARLRADFAGPANVLGRLFSPARALDVGGAAADRIGLRLSDEGMARLAKAITDPAAVDQLRKLRLMSPNQEKTALAVAQFLGVTPATATGAREPSERAIPEPIASQQ